MNIKSQKGFALGFAIFFVVLAAISSVAMYSAAFYLSNEVTVKDLDPMRGHYISMAGMRYAKILLKNPTTAPPAGFGFSSTPLDGESHTLIYWSGDGLLGTDLNLTGNDLLTVTATYFSATGYTVSASFTS